MSAFSVRRSWPAASLAICVAWVAAPASAASPGPAAAGGIMELPTIHVTATRPSLALEQPGTSSSIGRQQMDRQLVTTIRDLVRYEPGVSAIGTGGRFGLDSFNIRGLSGNRSYLQVDGIPQPDAFGAAIGEGSFRAGRNFIDLDDIRQVEILRGPISPLYPSDALGGAVILTTRDPADYLGNGRRTHWALQEHWRSADRSFATAATFAAGDPRNGFLLRADHRHGHETRNKGDVGGTGATRTRPDPLHYDADSVLAKYVHIADDGRSDRVVVNATRTRNATTGYSELTPSPYTGVVPTYYRGQGDTWRTSIGVRQSFPRLDSAFADTLEWNLYWQRNQTHAWTQTDDPPYARFYDLVPLAERVAGGKLVAVRELGGDDDAVAQAITYGIAASNTHASARADGYGIDLRTGERGRDMPFLAGRYPLELVPPGNTRRFALFAQDAITLAGGRLTVTPGIRIERYAYHPQSDAAYEAANPGYVQRDYTRSNVAPKLGALWHLDPHFSVYADYAFGFRPPLFHELSGAWSEQPVPGLNIAYLPSPGLEAETARTAEAGLRGQWAAGWFSIAGYYNRYRNFIWSGAPLASADVPDWAYQIAPGAFYNLFFRSVNAPRATIKGLEASGRLELGAFDDALAGWSLRAAAAIASGALVEPGAHSWSPLNTVDPAKLVVGVAYEGGNWGAELIGTAVRRHTRLDDASAFRPAGYGLLDAYAHWTPNPRMKLYAGINNLTDRKYWDWGSLNGGALGNFLTGNGVNDAGTGGLPADRLSMPGRTFSVAVKITF